MSPHDRGALERVSIDAARAVLLLADREYDRPDRRTLLLSLRVETLLSRACVSLYRPNVVAEVVDPRQAHYIRQAGVDEVVCATEMLYRVFAQAVNNPDIVPVFQDLLRVTPDTNEIYLVHVPAHLIGATWRQAFRWYCENRSDDNPALLLGYRTARPECRLVVNPLDEAGLVELTADHRLLVMQYEWTC